MVKTKNGIKQIVALVLIVALAVASLLLAIPKNSKSVYAASIEITLYEPDTLETLGGDVKKTQEQLIADGDISITDGQLKILNKNLEGDLKIEIYGEMDSYSGLFENCSKLTKVKMTISQGVDKDIIEMDRLFYGCSSLRYVTLTSDKTLIHSNTNTKDMFTGCSSLEEIFIGAIEDKTFSDLGLEYEQCETDGTTYAPTDIVPEATLLYPVGYKGSTTPSTPSTGVATDMLGLVVTAVIVLAICYVASKKKKVQR